MSEHVDAHVQVRDLIVQRAGFTVLEIEALDIPRGEVSVVIGPNGSGKSTLLAAMQLVLHPTQGTLTLDGEPMHEDPVGMRRRMSAAFQEPLLLSRSVRANIELPLRLRGVPRRRRRELATHWLERFGIAALADRHARQLSGGEAQRVSLARAFASRPEVMLLDEPFAGVDAPTREQLIADFADILNETRPTTVLVTHDRDEALRLGDHAVLLIEGRVRQAGTVHEIFDHPVDTEAARFVGVENIFSRESWPFQVAAPRRATICVRAENLAIERGEGARVIKADPAGGATVRIQLRVGAAKLIARTSRPQWQSLGLEAGDKAKVSAPPEAVHIIHAASTNPIHEEPSADSPEA